MLNAIITGLLQSLGVVAMVAFALEASMRLLQTDKAKTALAIVVFVTGVVCTMAMPVSVSPGVLFDLRYVFLLLAPFYGGVPTALATAVVAGAFRLYLGGVGAVPGVIGIVACAAYGMWAAKTPRVFGSTLRGALLLALGACASYGTIFLLPRETAFAIVSSAAAPHLLATFFSVFGASVVLRRGTQAVTREATLSHQADTDALTGLYNAAAFDRMAPILFERASRYAQPCSLLMVHVDGTTAINEHFGRNARDLAFAKAAGIVAATVPPGHFVARIGAQEIAVLLLAKDAEYAKATGEDIRAAVAAHDYDLGTGSARLYASIGLDLPRADDVFSAAIERVDAALLRAKRNGRNRVELSWAA